MNSTDPGNLPSARPSTLHVSRSADRSLTLLDTVVSSGSMSLAEAAEATTMPTSTALRHLRSLALSGWLIRDDRGRFSGGPTLLRIALRAFRSGPFARLTAAAQPHLEAIVDMTRESAYLAVRDGRSAVYIATVESPRSIRHVGWVGREAPISGTAIGRSLTAALPAIGEPPPIATNTGAVEPDISAVTVPIYDHGGVVAAFSVLGPSERMHDSGVRIASDALVAASIALGRELAATSEDPTV